MKYIDETTTKANMWVALVRIIKVASQGEGVLSFPIREEIYAVIFLP